MKRRLCFPVLYSVTALVCCSISCENQQAKEVWLPEVIELREANDGLEQALLTINQPSPTMDVLQNKLNNLNLKSSGLNRVMMKINQNPDFVKIAASPGFKETFERTTNLSKQLNEVKRSVNTGINNANTNRRLSPMTPGEEYLARQEASRLEVERIEKIIGIR